MDYVTRFSIVTLMAILICIPFIADAASVPPDSSITYTITLQEDGTAIWHVEYRTLLASDEDVEMFDTYAGNLSSTLSSPVSGSDAAFCSTGSGCYFPSNGN